MKCTSGTVRCPICNEIFFNLNLQHLKKHNLTLEEFTKQYPEYKIFTKIVILGGVK
jgi:hypothetical protein